jgi:hypothetical protein
MNMNYTPGFVAGLWLAVLAFFIGHCWSQVILCPPYVLCYLAVLWALGVDSSVVDGRLRGAI